MSRHGSAALDTRVDSDLGTVVHVVRSRQSRPDLPSRGCPFCVGGLEASEPYDVKAFPNRWPARWRGDISPWCNIEIVSPWRAPGV